jgi:hypothetical protein
MHQRSCARSVRADAEIAARVFTGSLAALLSIAAACGRDSDIVDPGDGGNNNVLGGLVLSAVMDDVTPWFLSARVTLTNTTAAAIDRTYPAGCPVLLRLYRESDQALVYDEGQRPCVVTTPIGFRVEGQASTVLASGTRFNPTVAGDSIPAGTYRAAVLLRITGMNPIEIEAGTYRLASCDQVTATCTHAEETDPQ